MSGGPPGRHGADVVSTPMVLPPDGQVLAKIEPGSTNGGNPPKLLMISWVGSGGPNKMVCQSIPGPVEMRGFAARGGKDGVKFIGAGQSRQHDNGS